MACRLRDIYNERRPANMLTIATAPPRDLLAIDLPRRLRHPSILPRLHLQRRHCRIDLHQ